MAFKLLVADDSQTIHKIVKLTLSPEGIELEEARSKQEALDKIDLFQPDLLLMDAQLDESDGLALVKEFREKGIAQESLPIVLLYGALDSLDEKQAKEAGAQGIFAKPFESSDLVKLVKSWSHKKPPGKTEEPVRSEPFQENTSASTPEAPSSEKAPADFFAQDDLWEESVEDTPNVDTSFDIEKQADEDLSASASQAIRIENDTDQELEGWEIGDDTEEALGQNLDEDFEGFAQEDQRLSPPPPPAEAFQPSIEEASEELEDLDQLANDWKVAPNLSIQVNSDREEPTFPVGDQPKTDFTDPAFMMPNTLEPEAEPASTEKSSEKPANRFSQGVDSPSSPQPEQINASPTSNSKPDDLSSAGLPREEIERIVRETVEKKVDQVLERIAWDVVPDLAENKIQKEIHRLLDEEKKKSSF